MHPRFRQVPPSASFSMRATCMPAEAAYSAAAYPPGPPPMTTRSNDSLTAATVSGRPTGHAQRDGAPASRGAVTDGRAPSGPARRRARRTAPGTSPSASDTSNSIAQSADAIDDAAQLDDASATGRAEAISRNSSAGSSSSVPPMMNRHAEDPAVLVEVGDRHRHVADLCRSRPIGTASIRRRPAWSAGTGTPLRRA